MSDFSSGKWGRLAKLSGGIVKAGTSLAKEKLKEKIQNINTDTQCFLMIMNLTTSLIKK